MKLVFVGKKLDANKRNISYKIKLLHKRFCFSKLCFNLRLINNSAKESRII